MSDKKYFSYNKIHDTVKSLSQKIIDDNYEPELMVAIGSGGFIPARMMKTFIEIPILAVGVKYYTEGSDTLDEPCKIQWIDDATKKLEGKKILLVDEVDDTRATLEYCIKELLRHNPKEIAVAVIHHKEKPKKGIIPTEVKRYYAGESFEDAWCCYPWDAKDIFEHERLSNS